MTRINRFHLHAIQACRTSEHYQAILTQHDGPTSLRFCLNHQEGPLLRHFQRHGTVDCRSPYGLVVLLLSLMKPRIASALIQRCRHGGFIATLQLEHAGKLRDLPCSPAALITLATLCDIPIYVSDQVIDCSAATRISETLGAKDTDKASKESIRTWLENVQPRDFTENASEQNSANGF